MRPLGLQIAVGGRLHSIALTHRVRRRLDQISGAAFLGLAGVLATERRHLTASLPAAAGARSALWTGLACPPPSASLEAARSDPPRDRRRSTAGRGQDVGGAPRGSCHRWLVRDHAPAPAVRVLSLAAAAAAGLSAAVFVVFGLLLYGLSATATPPLTAGNPTFVALVKVFFLVASAGFAVLYAWRYLSVAGAARRGTLDLGHRRRLRRARTTVLMAVLVFAVATAGAVTGLPPAAPLALTGLVLATAWAGAAVTAVRADRAQPENPRSTVQSGDVSS